MQWTSVDVCYVDLHLGREVLRYTILNDIQGPQWVWAKYRLAHPTHTASHPPTCIVATIVPNKVSPWCLDNVNQPWLWEDMSNNEIHCPWGHYLRFTPGQGLQGQTLDDIHGAMRCKPGYRLDHPTHMIIIHYHCSQTLQRLPWQHESIYCYVYLHNIKVDIMQIYTLFTLGCTLRFKHILCRFCGDECGCTWWHRTPQSNFQ